MSQQLQPPTDPNVVTLWLGNIADDITEADIQGAIYPYGVFRSTKVIRNAKSAFVEYVDRPTAEYAAAYLSTGLNIKGHVIPVNWAKPKPNPNMESSSKECDRFLPPPPGMEKAPVHIYALPGLARPEVTVAVPHSEVANDNTDQPRVKRQKKEIEADLNNGKAAALDYLASYSDSDDQ